MTKSFNDTLSKALSDEVAVDFSAARDSDFSPIPPGRYPATVASVETGVSKAGEPKVVFQFKLDGPPEHAGRVFFKHCVTRGTGSGILRDVLRGLGFDVDGMTKFRPSDALGRSAVITVRFQKGSEEFQEISKVEAAEARPLRSSGTRTRSRRL